jgi:hypothetical protein
MASLMMTPHNVAATAHAMLFMISHMTLYKANPGNGSNNNAAANAAAAAAAFLC